MAHWTAFVAALLACCIDRTQQYEYCLFVDVDYVKDAEDKVADLTYDKKCPSRGIVNKSTCPSYPVITFNPYRLPSVVVEARCSCDTCLTLAGRSPHTCKPIYYYRSVLEVPRRHRQGRPLCYVRVVRRFSVGCQCAFSQREKIASTKTPMWQSPRLALYWFLVLLEPQSLGIMLFGGCLGFTRTSRCFIYTKYFLYVLLPVSNIVYAYYCVYVLLSKRIIVFTYFCLYVLSIGG